MADIFLSYARKDTDVARRIVDLLEAGHGWTVWYDPDISFGTQWELEIERQLDAASCVIVLWSANSVDRSWVRTEASYAREHGILVPAKIDDTEVPIAYRLVQTADLTDWLKGGTSAELERFVGQVKSMIRMRRAGTSSEGAAGLHGSSLEALGGEVGPDKSGRPRRDKATKPAAGWAAGTRDRVDVTLQRKSNVSSDLAERLAEASPALMITPERAVGQPRTAAGTQKPARVTPAGETIANVFVSTSSAEFEFPHPERRCRRRGRLWHASISLPELRDLATHADVNMIELADAIVFRDCQEGAYLTRTARNRGPSRSRSDDVLIGVVGVHGFDFAHPDFRAGTGTRFCRIWDQSGQRRANPSGFDYGSELSQQDMDAAIHSAEEFGIPAQLLERQSRMVASSASTHIASVAAGNTGYCPTATLAGVILPFPSSESQAARMTYDATHIADAVDYLFGLGRELNLPVSIVMTVGTGGAHDGNSGIARWLDEALLEPGRCITVPACSSGEDFPGPTGPWSEVLGNSHAAGRVAGARLSERIEWVIPGNGLTDENEATLSIWYAANDSISVSVKPPSEGWLPPVDPNQGIENRVLRDGTFLSLYNTAAAGAWGNRIDCTLSPRLSHEGLQGIRAGVWVIRLTGLSIRDGAYRAWVAHGGSRFSSALERAAAGSIAPYISERCATPGYAITGIACAERVMTVANLVSEREEMHPASPRGPTRDGRQKPEVLAPGTDVVGANGFDYGNPLWVELTGPAVAAAAVGGVAARMLSRSPDLRAETISEIVCRTASPLPGAGWEWHPDSCFGVIDPHEEDRHGGSR